MVPFPSEQPAADAERQSAVLQRHDAAAAADALTTGDSEASHLAPPAKAPPRPSKQTSYDTVISEASSGLGSTDDLDELVREWARLKLENKELAELCASTEANFRRLETTNTQIVRALHSAPAAMPAAIPAYVGGGVVVVVEDAEDVDGAAEVEEEVADEVVYRSAALPADDADDAAEVVHAYRGLADGGDDDDESVYRGWVASAAPAAASADGAAAADADDGAADGGAAVSVRAPGKRARSFCSEIAAEMLQPRKQASLPSLLPSSLPSSSSDGVACPAAEAAESAESAEAARRCEGGHARPLLDSRLERVREHISHERRLRASLLAAYHQNEEMLRTLQANFDELTQQLEVLRAACAARGAHA